MLSSIITPLFCNVSQSVPLNLATALSVDETGHVTSPAHVGKSDIGHCLVIPSALSTKTIRSSVVGTHAGSQDIFVGDIVYLYMKNENSVAVFWMFIVGVAFDLLISTSI